MARTIAAEKATTRLRLLPLPPPLPPPPASPTIAGVAPKTQQYLLVGGPDQSFFYAKRADEQNSTAATGKKCWCSGRTRRGRCKAFACSAQYCWRDKKASSRPWREQKDGADSSANLKRIMGRHYLEIECCRVIWSPQLEGSAGTRRRAEGGCGSRSRVGGGRTGWE